ncbi:MAG: ParM/StbA family protein [Burkholderiales bacterium]|nr:MAG: ParM/StbA family protein [Burkholderiales bacterium]
MGIEMVEKSVDLKVVPQRRVIPVGVDDGYRNCKVVFRVPDGEIREVVIPSRARAGAHGVIQMGDSAEVGDTSYEVEGEAFTIGRHLPQHVETRFPGYHTSGINRAIIHHALRVAGLGEEDVSVCAGLPFGDYYVGGRPNRELIDQKTRNLLGVCATQDVPGCATVRAAQVMAQGVAAFLDSYLGNPSEGANISEAGPVGVVDIGGGTTDCVVVLPPLQIDSGRGGTVAVGMLDVYGRVDSAMRSKFSLSSVPQEMISHAVLRGRVRLYGRDEDVSDMARNALEEVAPEILRAIQRTFGQALDLDRIIVVGGGAEVFAPLLQSAYPQVRVGPRPLTANARGMLLYHERFARGGDHGERT